jgi:thiamine kinase-like enzyme
MITELSDLLECLPTDIRNREPQISRIAAGLSGAGVYLVKTDTDSYVLKIADETHSPDAERRRVRVQQMAGDRGVGPRVVHVDEKRNAILTTFAEDHSFAMLYFNPATRESALQLLAHTLRTVHSMNPGDAGTESRPAQILDMLWHELDRNSPAFVSRTLERVRSLAAPSTPSRLVFCHNDVNPSNIRFDGERTILLDWETSGAGDPYYDLASASVFFRMDDATCVKLISYHDDADAGQVPARFRYNQCLVAGLCGSMFVRLASNAGYSAAVDPEAITALADIYGMMRSGELDVSSREGQFKFGLALLKEAKRYAELLEQT